jgi:hypothetical protein
MLKRMAEKGMITEEERRQLSQGNGGKTNPELLEWLMGYERAFTQLLPTPVSSLWKGSKPSRYVGGVNSVTTSTRSRRPLPVGVLATRTRRGSSG